MAIRAMNAAVVNGTWVLLQNCELGLGLMNEMEVSASQLAYTGEEKLHEIFSSVF